MTDASAINNKITITGNKEYFDNLNNNNKTDVFVTMKRKSRSPAEMIYDALKSCEKPTPLYSIMQLNTVRSRELVKEIIYHELIQKAPTNKTNGRCWTITDKGREYLKDFDLMFSKYPFLKYRLNKDEESNIFNKERYG